MVEYIKTGVIGHPIAHSKSPLLHNYWIQHYGLSGTYEAIDIAPEDLQQRLPDLIHNQGYRGFNLTIPHKEIALNLCDHIDDLAKNAGAVNTVYEKQGKIFGTNTDIYGFIQNLQPYDCTCGSALILGAGGAARAAIYGLLQEGCPKIIVTNRTRAKAERLVDLAPDRVSVQNWEDRHKALHDISLLVNTTSLGMVGHHKLDLNLATLPQHALVNDIVYAPLMTDLLVCAQSQGNPIRTGIGMLLHQAAPAFQRWYGHQPEVNEMLIQKVQTA